VTATASGSALEAEELLDVFGESVVNLAMAGDRLALTGGGVPVEVVAAAVTKQNAAGAFQLADQITALHTAISLS
jgi:hypothetical protein